MNKLSTISRTAFLICIMFSAWHNVEARNPGTKHPILSMYMEGLSIDAVEANTKRTTSAFIPGAASTVSFYSYLFPVLFKINERRFPITD